jgi:phage recombination protein Bet
MNKEVPAKPSLIGALARQYEMDPAEFFRVIKATIMPSDATQEQTAAFLMVAKEFGLSPLLKEIHAFRNKKSGGIIPVISVDGWSAMVNRHPQFDGCEFSYENGETGVIAITCQIWRKDRSRPVTITEFMTECRRSTDAWDATPSRMLRHRAFMQCARLAFGFSGAYDDETAESLGAVPVDITPADQKVIENAKPKPPSAPQKRPPSAPTPGVKEKAEKSDTSAAGPKDSGQVEDFVQQLAEGLEQCTTDEEIDALVEEMDVAASLTGDEDALDLAEALIGKARKRLA